MTLVREIKKAISNRNRTRRDIEIIRKSGLFDVGFYREQCPELPRQADPIRHFVGIGVKNGLKPNREFDAADYLFANPDLDGRGINPFVHYILHGRLEGRSTGQHSRLFFGSGVFDEAYYVERHPDVREHGWNPFIHYLRFGLAERRSPNRDFDWTEFDAFRATRGPDILEAMASYSSLVRHPSEQVLEPIAEPEHRQENGSILLEEIGFAYKFDPNLLMDALSRTPLFDKEWYANLAGAPIAEATRHYAEIGVFLDLPPGPFFCPRLYRHSGRIEEGDLRPPVLHFITLADSWDLMPHRYFNSQFYQSNAHISGLSPLNAYLHFVQTGSKLGYQPSPEFDPAFYRSRYGDARPTEDGFSDFLLVKSKEGRVAKRPAGRSRERVCDIYLSIIIDATAKRSLNDLKSTLRSLNEAGLAHYEVLIVGDALGDFKFLNGSMLEAIASWKIISIETSEFSIAAREKIHRVAKGSHILFVESGVRFRKGAFDLLLKSMVDAQGDLYYGDNTTNSQGRQLDLVRPGWSPTLFASWDYLGPVLVASRGLFGKCVADAGRDVDHHINHWRAGLARRARAVVHVAGALADELEAPVEDQRVSANFLGRSSRAPLPAKESSLSKADALSSGSQAELSIVICTHNNSDRLLQTISKIIGTHPSAQIIVVDGFSKQSVLPTYKALSAERGVTFVNLKRNFSTVRAYNLGADHAKGKHILFVHDDIWAIDDHWLDKLLDRARVPNIGVAGPLLVYQDLAVQNAGLALGAGESNRPYENWCGSGDLCFVPPYMAREVFAVSAKCLIVDAGLFRRAGKFHEGVSEDWAALLLCHTIRNLGGETILAGDVTVVHEAQGRVKEISTEIDNNIGLRALASMNVARDPYWNDRLADRSNPVVARATADERTGRDRFISRIETAVDAGDHPWFLAFWHDDILARRCSLDARDVIWREPFPTQIVDELSAARWIISILRRRPDLRQNFVRALSDGASGLFLAELEAHWDRYGLQKDSLPYLRRAFEAGLGRRPRDHYISNPDIMASIPFGLVNEGLLEYLVWLLKSGSEHDFSGEEIWWFVIENLERPDVAMKTYLGFEHGLQREQPALMSGFHVNSVIASRLLCINSAGQFVRVYDDLERVDYRCRLVYNQEQYLQWKHPDAFLDLESARDLVNSIQEEFLATNSPSEDPLADRDSIEELAQEICRPSANIFSHFFYPSGLKTSVDSISRGLTRAGVKVYQRDVPANLKTDVPGRSSLSDLDVGDVSIIHVQPEPFFDEVYKRAGIHERSPRPYQVAYWYWELEDVPKSWMARADRVDEIWAATRFNYDAFKKAFNIPVFHLAPGLELPNFEPLDRRAFGLDEKSYIFLFSFHMYSIMERKNPLGLISAFRQAFGSSGKAQLVIKTTFGSRHPDNMRALHSAAAGLNVKIIDEVFTESQSYALLNACDCYVSLHRSEGYGLTMAEAMLLKKPVIATGYSGNLDFMTSETGLLVDYKLEPLAYDYPPYWAGAKWAEPSIAHAAECMKRLERDRNYGRRLGEAGFERMKRTMTYEAAGRRMAARLGEITEQRRQKRATFERAVGELGW